MTNTSNKQHEIGKPKGSSHKKPAQNFDHRKTKIFCFRRGKYVVYNAKNENAGSIFVTPTTASKFRE